MTAGIVEAIRVGTAPRVPPPAAYGSSPPTPPDGHRPQSRRRRGRGKLEQVINGMHLPGGGWGCVEVVDLAPGSSCGEHLHAAREEIYVITAGRAVMRVNGSEIAVSEGDLITCPWARSTASASRPARTRSCACSWSRPLPAPAASSWRGAHPAARDPRPVPGVPRRRRGPGDPGRRRRPDPAPVGQLAAVLPHRDPARREPGPYRLPAAVAECCSSPPGPRRSPRRGPGLRAAGG